MLCNPCGLYFAAGGTLPSQEILAEKKMREETRRKIAILAQKADGGDTAALRELQEIAEKMASSDKANRALRDAKRREANPNPFMSAIGNGSAPADEAVMNEAEIQRRRADPSVLKAEQAAFFAGSFKMDAYQQKPGTNKLAKLGDTSTFPQLLGMGIKRVKVCATTHGPENLPLMRRECLAKNGSISTIYQETSVRQKAIIFTIVTTNAVDAAGRINDNEGCWEAVVQDKVRSILDEDSLEFGKTHRSGAGKGKFTGAQEDQMAEYWLKYQMLRLGAKQCLRLRQMAKQIMTVCIVVWVDDCPVHTTTNPAQLVDAFDDAFDDDAFDDDAFDDAFDNDAFDDDDSDDDDDEE